MVEEVEARYDEVTRFMLQLPLRLPRFYKNTEVTIVCEAWIVDKTKLRTTGMTRNDFTSEVFPQILFGPSTKVTSLNCFGSASNRGG